MAERVLLNVVESINGLHFLIESLAKTLLDCSLNSVQPESHLTRRSTNDLLIMGFCCWVFDKKLSQFE